MLLATARYLVPVAAAFVSLSVSAKCADTVYEITGVVTDEIGKPLANASVALAWIERGDIQGPAIAVTDERGRYAIRFRFHKWSGDSLFGEQCKGRLDAVTISAYRDNVRSDSFRVRVSSGTSISAPVMALGYRAE